MKKITKNAILVAGAALATTGAGVAVNNVTAHADTAISNTTQIPQTNQSQEGQLSQKNQQDQAQIDQIQQNASDVKAQHAQEIAQVSDANQSAYQSQASQINSDY